MTSLTESIYSYVYENGRTYQAYRPETYVRGAWISSRCHAPELTTHRSCQTMN